MDLATLIGLLGALAVIMVAVFLGGSAPIFLDTPSAFIMLGGTVMATLIKFPLFHFLGAFRVATKAFFYKGGDDHRADQ